MISNDIRNARALESIDSMKAKFILDFKTAYTEYHKNIQLSAYYSKSGKVELAESYDKASDRWEQRLSYVRDILTYMFDVSSDELKPIAKGAWKTVVAEVPSLRGTVEEQEAIK